MEPITILNRCHRFRGFVYQHAYFSADKKSIEVAVRPRKGSAAVCQRCHLPAPGYDHLVERRFEFIPLWGFLVILLYTMRRVDCRRCGGFGRHSDLLSSSPVVRMRAERRFAKLLAVQVGFYPFRGPVASSTYIELYITSETMWPA